MTTPSARFIIGFDADTSGIDQSKASLDSLKASITKDTAALKEMSDAMARLKGTAEVIKWEGLQKSVGAAEGEVAKLAAKMAKLKADFAAAPAGKQEGIFAKGLETSGELDKATARLKALKAERDKLGKTEQVKLFEDLKGGADKLKQKLGASQTLLSRLGGSMGGAEAASSMKDLAAGADAAGVSTSGLTSKLKALKDLGVAGWAALAGVGLAALAVAFGAAFAKATAFAVSMSDAARSARLLREAAAGSSSAAEGLYQTTLAVEEKSGAQRDTVVALTNEYANLKLSLGAIEGATTAVTIASSTMGDQVGSTIKGLIDRGMTMRRLWLNPLDLKGTGIAIRDVAVQLGKQMHIGVGAAETALRQGVVKIEDGAKAMGAAFEESHLGKLAKEQALALSVQFGRAKDNIGRLFDGVKIGPFLEKLSDALGLFKETSDTGKALKQAFTALFQPFVDSASDAMPAVEQMIWETTIAIQEMVIEFLKAGGAKAFFKDAKASALGLWETLKDIAAVVSTIGKGIGLVKDGLGLLVVKKGETPLDNVKALADKYTAEGTKNGTREMTGAEATSMGIAIDAGIAKGLDSSGKSVSAIVALSDRMKKAFDAANEIHSPSKLYQRRAIEIPRGAAKGIEDGKPHVARALASLADPADMSAPGAVTSIANSSRAEDRSVHLTVNYQGGGSRRDALRFGQDIADFLETVTLSKGLPA